MTGEAEGPAVPADAFWTAVEAATRAGREVRNLHGLLGPDVDTQRVVVEAEYAAEDEVAATLLGEFPDHTLLFEEDLAHAGTDEYVWLVDPLDGTDSFRTGGDEYAVSVALYADGRPVVGVVTAPAAGRTFAASVDDRAEVFRDEDPAWGSGDPIQVSATADPDDATLASGYDRGGHFLRDAASPIERRVRRSSAALNLCDVARGEADGHWEFDTYPWDIAAGVVIARQAGAKVTDATGDPFEPAVAPTADRKSLLASNDEFHDALEEYAETALSAAPDGPGG